MSRFHSKILALLFVFLLLLMVSACSSTDEMDDSGTTDDSVVCSSSYYCLPDTGQTESYTSTFGEDSDYLIHPPAYRDNGDGTVNDLNTGLMWQQATADSRMEWDDGSSTPAGDYCDALSLAGYSDWRLPTFGELQSIVDYGESEPAIDTTAFPGTKSSFYWSSTTVADSSYTHLAWGVHFSDASNEDVDEFYRVFPDLKNNGNYVRCVRGSSSASTFTDNGDDTVTDQKTRLVWQQETSSSPMTSWEAALTYCEDLTLGGQSDWRLPNIKELDSIVDRSRYNPAIDTTFFSVPAGPTEDSWYWSSTTGVDNTANAWELGIEYGDVDSWDKTDTSWLNYVRCVRGGN